MKYKITIVAILLILFGGYIYLRPSEYEVVLTQNKNELVSLSINELNVEDESIREEMLEILGNYRGKRSNIKNLGPISEDRFEMQVSYLFKDGTVGHIYMGDKYLEDKGYMDIHSKHGNLYEIIDVEGLMEDITTLIENKGSLLN